MQPTAAVLTLALATLPCSPLRAASAPAPAPAAIEEWPVPWPNTRPRDPSVGLDGRVWFVGQQGNYLAVFDPQNTQFQRYELPVGTAPHTVVVDAEGRPWVAGNGNGTLLRYASSGELEQTYTVPEAAGLPRRDPHTLAFDGQGGLWFTLQNGNAIGHLDLASEQMRFAKVEPAGARPYGIVSDRAGDAWAVLFGAGKLVHLKRANMALQVIELPRPLTRPRRLTLTADGAVWYGDYAQDYLGRYLPADGSIQEWPLPVQPAGAYAMVADCSGRVWLFASAPQPNLLWGFDPSTQRFLPALTIPSGGGAVRHAEYSRREGQAIWFGSDRGTLGRMTLSASPACE